MRLREGLISAINGEEPKSMFLGSGETNRNRDIQDPLRSNAEDPPWECAERIYEGKFNDS
jgi:hypothetical protein